MYLFEAVVQGKSRVFDLEVVMLARGQSARVL